MSVFGWGRIALRSSESAKSLYFSDIALCWNPAKGAWTCLLSHIWLIPMEVDPTFEQASTTAKPRSDDGFELSEMSTVSPAQFLLQPEQSALVRHHDVVTQRKAVSGVDCSDAYLKETGFSVIRLTDVEDGWTLLPDYRHGFRGATDELDRYVASNYLL